MLVIGYSNRIGIPVSFCRDCPACFKGANKKSKFVDHWKKLLAKKRLIIGPHAEHQLQDRLVAVYPCCFAYVDFTSVDGRTEKKFQVVHSV